MTVIAIHEYRLGTVPVIGYGIVSEFVLALLTHPNLPLGF